MKKIKVINETDFSWYNSFAKKIGLEQKAFETLWRHYDQLGNQDTLTEKLMTPDYPVDDLKQSLKMLAEETNIHPYTLDLYVLFVAAKKLTVVYEDNHLSVEMFICAMKDLVYKTKECLAVHGVLGTDVFDWFPGFYRLQRFAFGRLQYDVCKFPYDTYERFGMVIDETQDAYGLHIPSSGALDMGEVIDSLKAARSFFNKDKLIVVCHSWLFNPNHVNILPKDSNIIKFMDLFDIIQFEPTKDFHDAWRIFGKIKGLKVADYPEGTRLQKAYKSHLLTGGAVGPAKAVLIFDGEKILTSRSEEHETN